MYNNRFSNTGVQRNIIDPLGFLANGSRNLLETNFTGNGDQYLLSDYYVENADNSIIPPILIKILARMILIIPLHIVPYLRLRVEKY